MWLVNSPVNMRLMPLMALICPAPNALVWDIYATVTKWCATNAMYSLQIVPSNTSTLHWSFHLMHSEDYSHFDNFSPLQHRPIPRPDQARKRNVWRVIFQSLSERERERLRSLQQYERNKKNHHHQNSQNVIVGRLLNWSRSWRKKMTFIKIT